MKRSLVLLVAVLLSVVARGYQEWIPMIASFTTDDYGSARTTWRISTSGEWAYFANQRGLLEYSGTSWQRYELNNRSEVRSVMVMSSQQRVWVGGEYEFGYFDVGPQGVLQYHCVSDSLPAHVRADLGNVFDFYEMGGITYARCDYYIIIIAGEHMTVVHSRDKIFASAMWNGTVYMATDSGIMMLTGHQLLPIASGDLPGNLRVNTMIPFDKGILIASATSGLFYYDGFSIKRYETPVDALLRDGCVCSMASQGSRLAFGTLAFGLIVLDQKTGDVEKYDNSCGLQSNTVQSVAFDKQGNIWCGLNTGIDRVLTASPFTTLYRNPRSYGMGYTALLDGDKLYLGTNQGLFYAPYPVKYTDRQTVLLGCGIPMGTAWYLYRHSDGDVLLMHDHGAFLITDNRSRLIPSTQGVWACIPVKGRADMLFCGAYAGVYVLRKEADGQWHSLGQIEGITEQCRFISQTDDGQLNVYSARQDSVHTYRLSANLLRVESVESRHQKYIPDNKTGEELALTSFGPALQSLALDDHQTVIPYENGFMMVDKSRLGNENHSMMIEALYATEPHDSLLYKANFAGLKLQPEITYKYNSLRLEYRAAPLYPARSLYYQYRLTKGEAEMADDEGWSVPTTSEFRSFSNLREGLYTFEVRSLLAGKVQSADSLTFRILPPWYRTWTARLLFLLLMAMAAYALWKAENRRLERKKAAALKEKDAEVSNMKVEIDKLEKDKMELDLRHKSQELANLAVNMMRKNEILTEIKSDIMQVANRMTIDTPAQNKRNLTVIGNKIDLNMEGDEVLKRFEEEFDLIHDNFIKKLMERHPDLSYNERLMCAYLKMNLSTKEIAPLLNISVRGVETMRYRIRKKFGLERDNNLTEYMNSI